MTSGITGGLIGIEHGATDRNVLVDQFVAGSLIGMPTNPETVFATFARNQMNDRRAMLTMCRDQAASP
jgi:hypothetical protein